MGPAAIPAKSDGPYSLRAILARHIHLADHGPKPTGSSHWPDFRGPAHSSLEGDFPYTPQTVFDTFPWPQSPTRPQIEAVAKEAVALRQLRREVMAKMNWSLRDLYRTLDEPGSNPLRDAHGKLDAAVRAAYGMPKDADILAFLLALNQTCAAREAPESPSPRPACRCRWKVIRSL
jgi:hypothetical protein